VYQGSLHRLIARLSLLLAANTGGCDAESPSAVSARSSPSAVVNALPDVSRKSDAQIEEQFSLSDPSPSEPVVVGMMFDPPFGGAGDSTELIVYVRIARAHYVYAQGDANSTFSAVTMRVQFPVELQAQDDWHFPQAEVDKNGRRVFRDAVLLRCPVKVAADALTSSLTVNGQLSCQVCTDELCWPKRSIEVSAPFTIQSSRR